MKREEVIEIVYQHCPPEDAARIARTIEAWHVRRVNAEAKGAAEACERIRAGIEALAGRSEAEEGRDYFEFTDVSPDGEPIEVRAIAVDAALLVVVGAAPSTKDTSGGIGLGDRVTGDFPGGTIHGVVTRVWPQDDEYIPGWVTVQMDTGNSLNFEPKTLSVDISNTTIAGGGL